MESSSRQKKNGVIYSTKRKKGWRHLLNKKGLELSFLHTKSMEISSLQNKKGGLKSSLYHMLEINKGLAKRLRSFIITKLILLIHT